MLRHVFVGIGQRQMRVLAFFVRSRCSRSDYSFLAIGTRQGIDDLAAPWTFTNAHDRWINGQALKCQIPHPKADHHSERPRFGSPHPEQGTNQQHPAKRVNGDDLPPFASGKLPLRVGVDFVSKKLFQELSFLALQDMNFVRFDRLKQPRDTVQRAVGVVEIEIPPMGPAIAKVPKFSDQTAFQRTEFSAKNCVPMIPHYGQQRERIPMDGVLTGGSLIALFSKI
ncbi:MAG: hypothetical protein JWM11_2899 [Planctomycetaceae bacterium]|nr:hypothetical protein [Planctomycetaceae bacterium]